MYEAQIQAWLALYAAARAIGEEVLNGVKHLSHKTLSKEENELILAQWEDNVNRSAHNAGLDGADEGDPD